MFWYDSETLRTVLLHLQPSSKPIGLDEKLPGQALPPVDAIAAVVAPGVSDGQVKAHNLVHEMAEQLGLAGHLG